MTEPGLTRRSLLAATAGAVAGGLVGAPGALALAGMETLPQATPVLSAGSGQPPIIARRVWALDRCTPRVAPEYGALELAFVHHTENPNGYLPSQVPAMLRAIFLFHRDVKGWNDIGYNFVVDRFGRIFEARAGGIDEAVTGAQAGGYNYCSTGIAVLGEFGARRISPSARSALERLLAWKLSLHGVPAQGRITVRVHSAGAVYSRFPANARVSLRRIAGHRDADSTDCPGNALYGELPSLRRSVAALAGRPARVSLLERRIPAPAAAGEPASEPVSEPPGAPRGAPTGASAAALVGGLTFLDGTPIAGGPIEIQMRQVTRRGEVVREHTIARVLTGAGGEWSLPLSSTPVPAASLSSGQRGVWLRALCPGGRGIPATVSAPLHLGEPVLPSVPMSAPTPPAAPPPAG
jgi:hypothetical protein